MVPETLSLGVREQQGETQEEQVFCEETCFLLGRLYSLAVGLGGLPYERVPGPNSNVRMWGFPHISKQFLDSSGCLRIPLGSDTIYGRQHQTPQVEGSVHTTVPHPQAVTCASDLLAAGQRFHDLLLEFD